MHSTDYNSYQGLQVLLDTTVLIPRFPSHHIPHHRTPQPCRHPLTHRHSFTGSVTGNDLVPTIASLSPHPHSPTTQRIHGRFPPPTSPQPPMAIADHYIEHSGRRLPPQPPTAWKPPCHLLRPEEAPPTFSFTPHLLLRAKHRRTGSVPFSLFCNHSTFSAAF